MVIKDIFNFLNDYSIVSVIIALIVTGLSLIFDKFFSDKINFQIKSYIPFILSTILYFTYECIFVYNAFYASVETLYKGILSGSISSIIFSCIKQVKNGENITFNSGILLIQNIIREYVDEKKINKTAEKIQKTFENYNEIDVDNSSLIAKIAKLIKINATLVSKELDFTNVAILIINALLSLKYD